MALVDLGRRLSGTPVGAARDRGAVLVPNEKDLVRLPEEARPMVEVLRVRLSWAEPEASTVKKYSRMPVGSPATCRSPSATRKWKLVTRPKLLVPNVNPPSSEMSKWPR